MRARSLSNMGRRYEIILLSDTQRCFRPLLVCIPTPAVAFAPLNCVMHVRLGSAGLLQVPHIVCSHGSSLAGLHRPDPVPLMEVQVG